MDIFQTIVLALIQGFSEFLPISSSAHLILVPKFTQWNDQGLDFDVTLHLGTLTAVVYYYRLMLKTLWCDFFYSVAKRQNIGQSKLAWGVLLGVIPVSIIGFFFKDFIELNLRSVASIAYASLIFGGLLGVSIWVNIRHPQVRNTLNWRDVSFIAMMQVFALIPGASRSGVVITAGLLVGLSKKATIQFAFLLSIPVIALSAMLTLFNLFQNPLNVDWSMLLLGFVLSALSAYWTIVFFIKLLDKVSMFGFVIYRLLLGLLLLTL